MQYENWIDEENLFPVITALGWLCGYQFHESDKRAFETGLIGIDESAGTWFHYKFVKDGSIEISITMEPGSSNYTIRADSELDIKLAFNSIIGLGQCYRITEF